MLSVVVVVVGGGSLNTGRSLDISGLPLACALMLCWGWDGEAKAVGCARVPSPGRSVHFPTQRRGRLQSSGETRKVENGEGPPTHHLQETSFDFESHRLQKEGGGGMQGRFPALLGPSNQEEAGFFGGVRPTATGPTCLECSWSHHGEPIPCCTRTHTLVVRRCQCRWAGTKAFAQLAH